VTEHKRYAGTGRLTPSSPIKAIDWQMHAHVRPDQGRRESRKPQSACFVIGTNLDVRPLSDPAVIRASKAQAQAEGGGPIAQRPLVFCLVVVGGEETLPESRTADGDDVSAGGLFGDATPTAPPLGASTRGAPAPAQPTDGTAHLTLGFPTARRDSSGSRDRATDLHLNHFFVSHCE
jgi:hypothetical protein